MEIDEQGSVWNPGYAPYLDYRPLEEEEHAVVTSLLDSQWLRGNLESQVLEYAALQLVPEHLKEVRDRKEAASLSKQLGGGRSEDARALAYRLYAIRDRKKWAQEALGHNMFVTSWSDVQMKAASLVTQYEQLELPLI